MKVTSKLRFDRLNWKPDSNPKMLHRYDIFMVNTDNECPTCGGHKLSRQLLVYPTSAGIPRYDSGLIDTNILSPEDIAWCEQQCRDLVAKFPPGHEFWTKGI